MKIRNHILLIIFSLITLTITYGQSNEDRNYRFFKIKQMYQGINEYKNYAIITIDNSEDFLGHTTDNGGSLTGYYKGDSLKKIIEWVGLSNRVIQNEYYLDSKRLFFVYSTESRYHFNDSTQSFDYSKLDNVFTGRYYFDKGKLIDTILKDKLHNTTKQQDAATFLTSIKEYAKLLNKKRK